ncbi:DUF86 domain-containing protein [Gracilibacillus kekensis]|uniref:Uncharacterized conserved protein YutE, UPF0331/DUF86 family n=1 Tax=Gracilibacillus kekensis TaxID=1027249 RepID=A0A1M7MPH0_9BACI|nr:DUF86 domain-containing protein [Gracilibacillus kekensis]SHM92883.1 Uncharacterized conserved protein YutE, UPF0331/DUF86 family [Gracilibacillus kekensis]
MYFVDMRKMNATLDFFDETFSLIKEKQFETKWDLLALERTTQVLIESILDIGNMMIDGFIMRDPGSYLDIIYILIDEKVLHENDQQAYESIINIRKELVQNYQKIDHDLIKNIFSEHQKTYSNFTKQIRSYLANEMGVANTFSNQ